MPRERLHRLVSVGHTGTPVSPRFPLKGSFKGDTYLDLDVDTDVDVDVDIPLPGPQQYVNTWHLWLDITPFGHSST